MSAAEVLTPNEAAALHRRCQEDVNSGSRKAAWTRLMIVILDVFCGLRASEIALLEVGDVDVVSEVPMIRVPAEIAKKGSGRDVPLSWNKLALGDIRRYLAWRFGEDWHKRRREISREPFICSFKTRCPLGRQLNGNSAGPAGPVIECLGRGLDRDTIRKHFIKACALVLGEDAIKQRGITTHKGRHTFCSLALHNGLTLTQVRDAAGHSNINVTNIYLHAYADPSDNDCFGSMYEEKK